MHSIDTTFREDNSTSEEINKVFVSIFSVETPGEISKLEFIGGLGGGH